MDINEMNLTEIEARLSEINSAVESAEDISMLAGFEDEKRSLLQRKAELAEMEQRRADAEALNNGVVKPDNIIEIPKKEERKMFELNSIEYRNAWLKDLMGRELEAEERAAITGSASAIPQTTANKLAMRLEENALIGKVDVMNIPGYVRVPVYSTNTDANWTTTATDGADALTYIDLKPYQLIKTVEIGADLDKMGFDAFEAELVKAMANKVETALQKAIIVGSGSSQPTGLATTISTATGTFTKAGITKADLMTIMGKLPADFQQNACWIMPNAVFYEIMAIADLHGFAGVSEAIGMHIAGKPVIVDDNCIISSKDNIFYGDPSHYRLNIGEGIKVDKDLSVGFRSNSAVYRGVLQADGQLDLAAAFVRYTRSAS